MTNLVRFSPNTEMRRLQQQVDNLFDEFFPRLNSGGDSDAASSAVWSPRVDVSESEDHYHVVLDLPGVSKEDITINYQDGALSVSGERNDETTRTDDNFVRVERQYGRFYRSFRLPKKVDDDRIDATYEDGVLSIMIPKSEETKARRIAVS